VNRCLLDTGIAGDHINRRHGVDVRVREAVARGHRVGICLPVFGELYAGVELSASRARNRRRLLEAIGTFTLWPFDKKAAEEFGRLFALLRRAGRPMQQIDIQIAAIALSLGNCTVVSSDSDFLAIPGLVVENWADL
jgi:tRNA(fMet)-specific endonuclease VapC